MRDKSGAKEKKIIKQKPSVARGAWFSEVCSGRKTQETAVSKWVKCKMRNTYV